MSSLFSQLSSCVAANTPAASRKDTTEQKRAAIAKAHASHTAQAIERYKTAMAGGEWLTTHTIECKLGYERMVANAFLRKLQDLGLIERRNRYGNEVYNKKQGNEWRWKDGAQPGTT